MLASSPSCIPYYCHTCVGVATSSMLSSSMTMNARIHTALRVVIPGVAGMEMARRRRRTPMSPPRPTRRP